MSCNNFGKWTTQPNGDRSRGHSSKPHTDAHLWIEPVLYSRRSSDIVRVNLDVQQRVRRNVRTSLVLPIRGVVLMRNVVLKISTPQARSTISFEHRRYMKYCLPNGLGISLNLTQILDPANQTDQNLRTRKLRTTKQTDQRV